MSLDQPRVIDFLGTNPADGRCIVGIADPLEWNRWEHLQALEKKINAYLAFIESGEIHRVRPDVKGLEIEISIRCRFIPESEDDWSFLQLARNAIHGAGFRFSLIGDTGEIPIPD